MKNFPLHLDRQTEELTTRIKSYWIYARIPHNNMKLPRQKVLTRVATLRKLLDEIEQTFTEEAPHA